MPGELKESMLPGAMLVASTPTIDGVSTYRLLLKVVAPD